MPEVYVGNLASSVISADLLAHFSRAGGALRALAVTDRVSGSAADSGLWEWRKSPTGRRVQPFEQRRAERTPNQDRG